MSCFSAIFKFYFLITHYYLSFFSVSMQFFYFKSILRLGTDFQIEFIVLHILKLNFSNCRMNVWKYIIINIKNNKI